MRYALPPALLATPALAHEGAHLHPHGAEGWPVVVILLAIAGAVALVAAARR